MEFHFSLDLNEVFPGWVLYGNAYMIIRNEDKFGSRNQSKRSSFEMSIIRPDIVAMIMNARSVLSFKKINGDSFLDLSTFEITKEQSAVSVVIHDHVWNEEDLSRVYLEADVICNLLQLTNRFLD